MRKRKRSHEDDKASEEEGRHGHSKTDKKQQRSSADEDHDRKRKHRKQSHKHGEPAKKKEKKAEKHSKKTDKNKESKKESSSRRLLRVDKSKLYPMGDPLGHAPDRLLDADTDYFAFHKHLWLHLYRDCATAFNDLSSEEARTAFAEFCQLYNAGKLEQAYYNDHEGLPAAALEECKTTRHSWGFRISDREDKNLQVLQEGVHKQTEYHQGTSTAGAAVVSSKPQFTTTTATTTLKQAPPEDNRHRRTPEERQRERVENRRLREHVRTVNEELTGGRKEGRERQMEKRKQVSEKIHGAARERDAAGVELDDDALYGGSDRSQLERSKQRTAGREEKKQARVAELQNKEKEKQAAMLEMLGLSGKIKAGEKIKIAPRKDG